MLGWKKYFALAAWVGLLALVGCGGGGSNPGGSNPSAWGISGTVTGATAVTVNLTGAANASTTTDANGNYSFGSLGNGSYTLTPSKASYTFSPPSIVVTVNGGDVTGRNFAATAANTYSISGAVSGAIADGVLITLGGATTSTTTTAGGGLYSFSGLANGSYTLTPSKDGYTFSPASITVTVNGGNVTGENFAATATYSISGVVSGALSDGVLITLSGTMTGTTTTAGGGLYSFSGLANGSYTVTPSKADYTFRCYTFSPASIDVTVNGGNVTGQDFTAAAGFRLSAYTPNPFCVNLYSVDFGPQPIATTSAPRTVTLTNTSTAVATLGDYVGFVGWDFGHFSQTNNCPTLRIDPGASCTFSVTFSPIGTGVFRFGYLEFFMDGEEWAFVPLTGTGIGARSVAVAPDPTGKLGTFAYVTNARSNNVSMYSIDRDTGVLTALVPGRIAAGNYPVAVAVDPSGRFAYVANFGSDNVSMYTINPETGALTSIGSPVAAGMNPLSVAVIPDPTGTFGKFAYVANLGSNNVSMYRIDRDTGVLTPLGTIDAGLKPWSVAGHPSGNFVYVASTESVAGDIHYLNTTVSIYTVNPTTGVLTPAGALVTGGLAPSAMVVDPSGTFASVTNGSEKDVWTFTINPATGALTAASAAGLFLDSPTSVAIINLSGNFFAYVTIAGGLGPPPNSVYTYSIDAATGRLTRLWSIPAGSAPTSIAIDPSGKFAYVANSGSDDVSMYTVDADTGALTLIGTIGT